MMTTPHQFTGQTLADACGGTLVDASRTAAQIIDRVAPVHEAVPGAITWITTEQHAKLLPESRASAVIGTEALLQGDPRGIRVRDPEAAIADVLACFHQPNETPPLGVHPSAVVAPTAKLGTGVRIGACAVVGADAVIGDDTVIHSGVSVGSQVRIGSRCRLYDRCVVYDRCMLGNDVILQAGAVIGADGFGYIFRDGQHRKILHIGTVTLEDGVEIGANTCVDRGKFGETRIGRGSKIDNLVQIAHNVQTGPLCIITAQCGLSGSVRLGQGVVMGGQSGSPDGIVIGDGARLAARAVPWADVPAGLTVSGVPARDHKVEIRERARVRKLPKLLEQVTQLEKRIAQIEAAADHPKGD